MKILMAHTGMEMKLFFRETFAVLFTFIVPAVSFLVMSLMFDTQSYGGLDFYEAYIPSMIGIIIFTTAFFTMGLQIVIDREKGVYKRLQGTPLNTSVIFVSTVIKGLLAIVVGSIEIAAIARFVFDADLTTHVIQFLAAVLLSSVTFFALGFLVASIARRMQTALGIAFIAMYPMFFLSGATLPVEGLPVLLQELSVYVPLTYVVHVLRFGWNGTLFEAGALMDVLVLAGIFAVSAVISTKCFRWNH